MLFRLECEGLTLKETRELVALLNGSPDVERVHIQPTQLLEKSRERVTVGPLSAGVGHMEVLVLASSAGSYVLSTILGKPLEAFFEELGTIEWAKKAAQFVKTLPGRSQRNTIISIVEARED